MEQTKRTLEEVEKVNCDKCSEEMFYLGLRDRKTKEFEVYACLVCNNQYINEVYENGETD